MNANKKVEVNEASIAEWLRHEHLWDVKARAYKDCSARENSELFYIAKASPNSSLFSFSLSGFPC